MKEYKGKLIGKGSFGDVFRPPIPCKLLMQNKYLKYNSNEYVGKCYNNLENAKSEFDIQHYLKKIDPKNLFTIRAKAICAIQYKKGMIDHVLPKMHFPRPNYKVQIIFPFGGKHYYDSLFVMDSQMNMQDFFNITLFLVKNIAYLNAKKLYHSDIKEKNILYNSKNGLLYLLDFDFLAPDIDRVLNLIMNPKLEGFGPFNLSPEIRVLSGLLAFKPWKKRSASEEAEYFEKANAVQMKDVIKVMLLDMDIGPNDKKKKFEMLYSYFTRFSDWFKKDGDDILFTKINGRVYDEILLGVEKIARNKNDTEMIKNLFNSNGVLPKQDSWGLGIVLFEWLVTVYTKNVDESRMNKLMNYKSLDNYKLLKYLLHMVCNYLIQADIEKRMSTNEFYDTVLKEMQKSHKDIYKKYQLFEKKTEESSSNPNKSDINENIALNILFNSPKKSTSKSQPRKAKSPKVKTPKAKSPKAKSPKAKSPKVKSQKAKSQKVKSQKAKSPKVKSPKVKSPKVKTAKVNTAKVKSQKVKTAKVKSQKVNLQKFK
jgi:serine/threonine protein kinase